MWATRQLMAGGWCRGQPTTVKLSYVGGIAQKFSRVRKMSSIVLRWQTPSPEFCFSRRQRMRRRLLRCSRTFRRPTPALFRAAYFRRRGVQRSEAIARFLKRERVSRDPKTGGKPPASMSETCSNGKTGQDATLAGADRPDDRAPPSFDAAFNPVSLLFKHCRLLRLRRSACSQSIAPSV